MLQPPIVKQESFSFMRNVDATLEERKQMEIEVSGHHAQREHNHRGGPDVEAQLSAKKVRDRAEDECP